MATFLLVHGAWHDGSCWASLGEELARRGHESAAPDLPCDDVDATFEDYAQVASAAVSGSVVPVVVGHSFGGWTIPLVAARRPVERLVFLAAVIPDFGRGASPRRIEPAFAACIGTDAEGRGVWRRSDALAVMYAGLPRPVADEAAGCLRPQAWTPTRVPYPLARVPDVPRHYVRCARDTSVTAAYSEHAGREVLGVEPVELAAGHFPMLECPSALADLLCRLLEAPP